MTSLLVNKTVACHKRSSASSLCSRHREGWGKGRKETREDYWGEKVELPCLFPFTFFSLFPTSSPFCTCHASYWNTEEAIPVIVISWDLGSQHNTVGAMTCSCPTQSEGRSKWPAETRFQALERSLQTSPLLVSCVTSNL